VVDFARDSGLQVAAQGTGHNAAPLGSLAGTVLLKTEAMRGVRIDPASRTARAGAGALWSEVVEAAAEHDLAPLAGSSPNVGVVGYTLGGGMGWLGRRYGLSCNNVRAIEAVTADGRRLRVDADTDPELFWALRGGGGSFAVVTAVEVRLFPISHVYAGLLWWPIERGVEVLQAWRELTQSGLPNQLTTIGRYLRLPPLPELPEQVRGQSFALVEVIHLGSPPEVDGLLAPLRELGPEMDTIQTIPMPVLAHMHMDPEQPVPAIGDGSLLTELPADAVDELIRVGPAEGGSPLQSLELRHLGGEMAVARPGNGALASIEADYMLFGGGIAPTPEAASDVQAHMDAVKDTMAPWSAPSMYLNFAETSRDPSTLWNQRTYERLRQVKAMVDPGDLIRANHPVPLP
jgi:hypothetical protein